MTYAIQQCLLSCIGYGGHNWVIERSQVAALPLA